MRVLHRMLIDGDEAFREDLNLAVADQSAPIPRLFTDDAINEVRLIRRRTQSTLTFESIFTRVET